MPSPTPVLFRALRRLKLTTKHARKGYYKGNRVGSMGSHTKHGGFIIDWNKVRTYVAPDLSKFKLTPFVTSAAPVSKERPDGRVIGVFKEAYTANERPKRLRLAPPLPPTGKDPSENQTSEVTA